jgi:hypothetical protein
MKEARGTLAAMPLPGISDTLLSPTTRDSSQPAESPRLNSGMTREDSDLRLQMEVLRAEVEQLKAQRSPTLSHSGPPPEYDDS